MNPVVFTWDGECMTPKSEHWAKMADKDYVVGQTYHLVPIEDRSHKSHAHYFAAVGEAWKNLPDRFLTQFPTAEHLRLWALIRAGFANQRQIVASSKAEAQRIAAFLRPVNEYAIITASECVVTEWTAQSQSLKAMGKTAFQKSKDAVLQVVSDLIHVTPKALMDTCEG